MFNRATVVEFTISFDYKLTLPITWKRSDDLVLPIESFGGAEGTVLELLLEKKGLIPAIQQLLVTKSNSHIVKY
jgi:hypothetical protein